MSHVRLAVTGSRNYTDEEHVYSVLDNALKKYGRRISLHVGDANGVDKFAREWASDNNIVCIVYVAEWNRFGKSAGPIRNRTMLTESDKLLAFPGGKGTRDCIAAARHIGIEVEYV